MIEWRRRFCGPDFLLGMLVARILHYYLIRKDQTGEANTDSNS
jgi:hypothetical protein